MLYEPADQVSPGTRSRLIAIRLSQAERNRLDRIAAQMGVALSKLVRDLILKLVSPPADSASTAAAPPRGVLGDIPQGSWTEEFRLLGERAGYIEAHRKRLSLMLANVKVPPGFREWDTARRGSWLDEHYPVRPRGGR